MEVSEIKAYMKKYKITYAELATMTGINLTSIKRIFCGKTKKPHLETMVAIEQALGFINTNSRTAAPMGDGLTSEERELLSLFRELSPYLKGMTLNAVRSWAKNDGDSARKKV